MSAEQLLAHFDRISEAPDAIPALRRFILDLAVRGKLVEQDPKDETASELLKRIHEEREELIRRRTIKDNGDISQVNQDDIPFYLPTTWRWAPLGRLIVFGPQNGISPKPSSHPDAPKAITLTATTSGRFNPDYFKRVDANIPRDSEFWLRPGDLLFQRGNTREYVGIAAYYSGEPGLFLYPDLMMKIRLSRNLDLRYTHLCTVAPYSRTYFSKYASGAQSTMPKINQETLTKLPVAIPPLPEQRRIVAKVDELMVLCDRLEASQADRESQRNRLAEATLQRLSQPVGEDATAAREHARFYLRHLPRLTTRPDQIKQLRQAIRNLAFRGQLVPQHPDEEPVPRLMERIRTKREQLTKEGRLKHQHPGIDEGQLPFRVPTGWQWVRFGELIMDADAGWSPKSEAFPRSGKNWGVLKVSAVSWDRFLPEENKQLLPGAPPPKAEVYFNDFLISRANTSDLVAKSAVVDVEPQNLILSDKIVRLHFFEECNKNYLCMVNNHAEHVRSYYAEKASGTSLSMKNVSRPVIYELLIPLPPLAEQHRIVAKINELMTLCDQLEHQLTTTKTESGRLLEALLQEALTAA